MRVLLATDGKPHSEKAVEYGFALYKQFKPTFVALYVVDPRSGIEKDKDIKNGMRVLGRLKIRGADIGIEVATLLEAGDPMETILLAAQRIKADAIVLGKTTDRSTGGGLLGGSKSISEFIIKNSTCPVIVVKSGSP
ncbi:MAG: universal stress protein [Methanomassiliicoccales archaeon]|nr:MAG: universal stress protein [Methanomassiliicoccales archaeon]